MTVRRLGAGAGRLAAAAGRPERRARSGPSPATRWRSRSGCGAARSLPGLQVTLTDATGRLGGRDRTDRGRGPRDRGGARRHRRAVAGPARRPPSARRSPPSSRTRSGLVRARQAGRRAASRHRRAAARRARVVRAVRRLRRPPRRRPAAPAHPRRLGVPRHPAARPGRAAEPRRLEGHGQDGQPDAARDGGGRRTTTSRCCSAARPRTTRASRRTASFEIAVRAAGSMAAFTLQQRARASPCCSPSTTGGPSGSRRTRPAGARCSARWRRPSPPGPARLGPSLPGRHRRPDAGCAAASSSSSSSTWTTISSAPCSSCGGRASRSPWSTWQPRTAAADGAKTARRTTTRGRALAAAGVRYVRLHRADDLHAALGGGAVAAPGEGRMNGGGLRALLYVAGFVGLAADRGGRRRPCRRAGRRAAAARRGRRRHARRRARARPPARLAAGAVPAAARRLPAGSGAGARYRTARAAAERTSPSTPTSVRVGAVAYAHDVFPLDVAGNAGLRLLLSLVVYAAVGAAAFLALSLRRPLPAIVISSSSPASASRPTRRRVTSGPRSRSSCWPAACWPSRRSLKRGALRTADALAGGVTAVLAAVLALSIIGTTTVAAGRPLRDWRRGTSSGRDRPLPLRPDAELPAAARPRRGRGRHARPVLRAVLLAGERPRRLQRLQLARRRPRRTRAPAGPRRRASGSTRCRPTQPAPRGRLVTQRFEIVSTYTDRLFAGGWPTEVRTPCRCSCR